MKRSYLPVLALLAAVLSFSLVHAQAPPPVSGVSTSASLLGGLSSANSPMYAGFFAIVMFIIFAVALDRTQLSSGKIGISFVFALITFFILYSDPTLLHFFLNTFIVLAFIALILGLLTLVRSPRSIKLIGLLVALFLVMILFENDTGLTNFVNSTFHVSILSILPFIFGIAAVLIFAVLLLKGARNSKNTAVRVALLFIVFLMITLLIPGFAGFIFNPIVLLTMFGVIMSAIIIYLLVANAHRGPKLSDQDKLDRKEEKKSRKQEGLNKVKDDVLGSISKRKESNKGLLDEYRTLLKKKDLSEDEKLKLFQIKDKLGKSAWENVQDRVKLTKEQYSPKQLSNNKDLKALTSSLRSRRKLEKLRKKSETAIKKQEELRQAKLQHEYDKSKEKSNLAKSLLEQKREQERLAEQAKMAEAALEEKRRQEMLAEQAKMAEAALEQKREQEVKEAYEASQKAAKKYSDDMQSSINTKKAYEESQRITRENTDKMQQFINIKNAYDESNRISKEYADNMQKARNDQGKPSREIDESDNINRNPSKEMEQQIDDIDEYLKKTEPKGKNPLNKNNLDNEKKSKTFTIPIFGKKNNGMFRRKVVEDTGKNNDISKEAGTDVNNAKTIAGSNITQAETRMFELSQEAYNNPDPVIGQKIINLVKSRHDDIVKIKDTNERNKAEAQLEKEVQDIINSNK